MFTIKICGITTLEDALAAVEAGADALGFNFYQKSPRFISPEAAYNIIVGLPPGVVKVGLFVDTPVTTIAWMFDNLGLDIIQLHGDQPAEVIKQLRPRPVIKVFRVGQSSLREINDYLCHCQEISTPPKMVIFDALVPGQYGGTGKTTDWATAAEYVHGNNQNRPPLILAGGLNPSNVAQAIRTVRPAGVDTASGVEKSPGKKDINAMQRFVSEAKTAFKTLNVLFKN